MSEISFLNRLSLRLLFGLMLFTCVGSLFGQTNTYNNVTFSFTLTNGETDENLGTFHQSDAIVVKAKLENKSNESFPFISRDLNYLFRFHLSKVGEALPVAYRADIATILSIREETPGLGHVLILDPIFPNETQELAQMKLSDRFASLSPGSYKLNIEYKTGKFLTNGGESKELRLTSEVTFSVIP